MAAAAGHSRTDDHVGSVRKTPDISVVIAVLNERESLLKLADEIRAALDPSRWTWEVIIVDDGSTDGSRAVEQSIAEADPRFRVVQLRRNFGKAAALDVGFQRARGAYIVTMDGDLQDDPAEIANLVEPLETGEADLVSGWKWPRRDPLGKRLPSKLYNWATGVATGVHLHDMNCGLKAYRAEVLADIRLYGDMHRYIPVLAAQNGFAVTERKVSHRPRVFGHSKYAAGRFARGFLDLLTVLFLTRYARRPLHLIGGMGLCMGALGFVVLLYLTGLWFSGQPIGTRPLLMLGVLLLVVAGQFMTFGLLAEMLTYHQHREGNHYSVLRELGFDHDDPPTAAAP